MFKPFFGFPEDLSGLPGPAHPPAQVSKEARRQFFPRHVTVRAAASHHALPALVPSPRWCEGDDLSRERQVEVLQGRGTKADLLVPQLPEVAWAMGVRATWNPESNRLGLP
eukprot:gene13803-biopygen6137